MTEPPVPAAEPFSHGRAVLHEIAFLLEGLVRNGETATINLRRLPLDSADYDEIRSMLGSGVVAATVEAEGPSTVEETRYPGVWWVTHRDTTSAIIAELIEICPVPAILIAPPDDIALGAIMLTEELAA